MLRSFAAVAVVGVTLAGCSWLPNHSLDYRQAPVLAPMKMPQGMQFLGQQDLYAVPDEKDRLTGPRKGESGFEAPKPPQLVAEGDRKGSGNADENAAKPPPPGQDSTPVLGKDGSGYPIIMMPVSYAWAWEQVSQALTQTDLRVTDRNRDDGLFYLTVPQRYKLNPPQARLKLSHTTNGIEVAVLKGTGSELAAKDSSLAILERIEDRLMANRPKPVPAGQ